MSGAEHKCVSWFSLITARAHPQSCTGLKNVSPGSQMLKPYLLMILLYYAKFTVPRFSKNIESLTCQVSLRFVRILQILDKKKTVLEISDREQALCDVTKPHRCITDSSDRWRLGRKQEVREGEVGSEDRKLSCTSERLDIVLHSTKDTMSVAVHFIKCMYYELLAWLLFTNREARGETAVCHLEAMRLRLNSLSVEHSKSICRPGFTKCLTRGLKVRMQRSHSLAWCKT